MKAWEWAVWLALCITPLAVAAASLGSLPDTVAMHVGPDAVSIKATTTEGMNDEGRGLCISASAIASLV